VYGRRGNHQIVRADWPAGRAEVGGQQRVDTRHIEVERNHWQLQEQLVASLSIYKCPRRMFYVDTMPLTATGKLQRYALRQIAISSGEA